MKDFIDPLHRDFDLYDKRTRPYFYMEDEHMTFLEPPIPTAGEKRVFWAVVVFVIVSAAFTLAAVTGWVSF